MQRRPLASQGRQPSLGLVMPTFPQHRESVRPGLARWSAEAEAAGAAALWACDHLFWPGPTVECLTAVAFAAAGTEHCAVGTGVLQLPLRSTAATAKAAASLQELSGGRLVLGLGVGQHPGEYRAASADYASRGAALDSGIAELRRLWEPEDEPYSQRPVPERIPIWIGGSSARARRRAAAVGNGWMPLFVPAHRLRAELDRLDEEVEAAGRPPGEVVHALMVFVSVGSQAEAGERGSRWMSSLYGLPAERLAPHVIAGEAGRCAEALLDLHARGADHLALFVADDEPLGHFEAILEAMGAVRA